MSFTVVLAPSVCSPLSDIPTRLSGVAGRGSRRGLQGIYSGWCRWYLVDSVGICSCRAVLSVSVDTDL